MKVFCALMTMIGSSGRSFLMRGSNSNAFSSGITTSVTTRSPSPDCTQRQSVAAVPVVRTSYPARDSACATFARMAESSSTTRISPRVIYSLSGPYQALGSARSSTPILQSILVFFGSMLLCSILGHESSKGLASRMRFASDAAPGIVIGDLGAHQAIFLRCLQ